MTKTFISDEDFAKLSGETQPIKKTTVKFISDEDFAKLPGDIETPDDLEGDTGLWGKTMNYIGNIYQGFLGGAQSAEENRAALAKSYQEGKIGTPRALAESGISLIRQGLEPIAGGITKALEPIIEPIAGVVKDYVTEAFAPALGAITPDFIEEPIKKKANDLFKMAIDEYEAADPETQRSLNNLGGMLSAVFDIVTLIPVATGGKVVKRVTQEAIKKGIESETGRIIVKTGEDLFKVILTPIEKGVVPVSNYFVKSAEKQLLQVLNPTKETTKKLAKKIVPQMRERGMMALSIEGLSNKAKKGIDEFGAKIDEFELSGNIRGVTEKKNIINALEKEKELFTEMNAAGEKIILSQPGINAIDEMITTMKQFDDFIPNTQALRIKRKLYDIIDAQKAFLKETKEGTTIDLQKNVASIFREEIAKANPVLDKLNKEFSFYKGLEEILESTVLRRAGQKGIRTAIGTGAGGVIGGALWGPGGAALGVILAPQIVNFFDGTAWKTATATLKNKFAKALGAKDLKEAKEALEKILLEAKKTKMEIKETITNPPPPTSFNPAGTAISATIKATPLQFKRLSMKAQTPNKSLTDYSIKELKEFDIHILPNKNAGYAFKPISKDGSIELVNVFALEQGIGDGTKVIKDALYTAKNKGAKKVVLNAYKSLEPFYERFRFKTIRTEKFNAKLAGYEGGEDVVFMEYNF